MKRKQTKLLHYICSDDQVSIITKYDEFTGHNKHTIAMCYIRLEPAKNAPDSCTCALISHDFMPTMIACVASAARAYSHDLI